VDALIAVVRGRHGHNLLTRVEEAKIALSDAEAVGFRFDADEVEIATELTRADLNRAIADQVEKIARTIDEALRRAGVKASDIESLILTGGSTEVPAVAASLQARFPEAELVRTDAFGSVGMGLALDASRRF
jgi:hypothetical chaperone protein